MEFACVTVAILIGAIAERGRVFPAMVFTFFWTTLVYCPLAYWVWVPTAGLSNGESWILQASGFFFFGTLTLLSLLTTRVNLGGGPVEIGSGIGGLAYAWVLSR